MISHLHPGQIGILAGVNLLVFVLIAFRWEIILRSMGASVPISKLVRYRLTSFGVSYFTPGPQFGGEPAQVALLTRNHGVQTARAISSVYLDKLLELLVNILVIAAGMALVLNTGFQNAYIENGSVTPVFVLGVIPAAHLAALGAKRYPARWLVQGLGWLRSQKEWIRTGANLLINAEEQIAEFLYKSPKSLLLAISVSFLSWAMMVLEYLLMIRFLGLELNPVQAVFAFVLSRLAFLAPLPGGLGALEASQVFAMQTMGLTAASGLAVSLLMRFRDVLIGLIGLGLGGWTLARPAQSSQNEVWK